MTENESAIIAIIEDRRMMASQNALRHGKLADDALDDVRRKKHSDAEDFWTSMMHRYESLLHEVKEVVGT
jgi:hypothetical protein